MVSNTEPMEYIMPYPRCLKCGIVISLDQATYTDYEGPITCYLCKTQMRVKIGRTYTEGLYGQTQFIPKVEWLKPMVDTELLEGLLAPAIPQEIYNDYESTLYCFSAGVPPRAVAVMCRYTIQHALIIKGIPDDRPEKMVNMAATKGILSNMAVKQSQAAVWMGGKGGHPQGHWTLEITQEDAKQAVLLTRRVLRELFTI